MSGYQPEVTLDMSDSGTKTYEVGIDFPDLTLVVTANSESEASEKAVKSVFRDIHYSLFRPETRVRETDVR